MFVNVYRNLSLPIEIARSESKNFVEIEISVLSVELRGRRDFRFSILDCRFRFGKFPYDACHEIARQNSLSKPSLDRLTLVDDGKPS